ncbi:uncharacterized protein [Prorops nasuta]|uniref:uncharacterized protein n=1 Tax=Prorops nasuta TaxID=863751 RepID=UPI0034CE5FF7
MRSLKQVEEVNKAIVNTKPIIQPLQKIINTKDEDKILMKMEPRKNIRLLKRIHSETSTPIKEEEINTNRHTSANNAIELNRNLHDTSPTNDNIINLNESFNNQPIEEETSLPMEYISIDESPVSKQYATIHSVYARELLLGQHETIDDVFGIYTDPRDNKLYLGNKIFHIDSNDVVTVGEKRYQGTKGLIELLLIKKPNETLYNDEDLKQYKDILQYTSAHRRGHIPGEHIKCSKGDKYMFIIKPLFSKIKGQGLWVSSPSMLLNRNNNIDYVHWDDPNELIDRLRLLFASQTAGNNSHQNEIISIIEEIKEAGFKIN